MPINFFKKDPCLNIDPSCVLPEQQPILDALLKKGETDSRFRYLRQNTRNPYIVELPDPSNPARKLSYKVKLKNYNLFYRPRAQGKMGYCYHLINKDDYIGNGSFGSVYALQGTLKSSRRENRYFIYKKNTSHVVKIINLKPKKEHDLETLKKEVQQEANISSEIKKLHAKNALTIITESDKTETASLFVMRKQPGIDLHQFIQGFNIPVPMRYKLSLALLRALEHIHAQGIIHQDIKPKNIMVAINSDNEFDISFVDFGCSRYERNSNTYIPKGTRGYTPPECINSPKPLSLFSSDVYSLAIVLGKIWAQPLSGSPKLDDESSTDNLITPISYDDPSEMASENVKVILNRMIQPNPADRPALAQVESEFDRARLQYEFAKAPNCEAALTLANTLAKKSNLTNKMKNSKSGDQIDKFLEQSQKSILDALTRLDQAKFTADMSAVALNEFFYTLNVEYFKTSQTSSEARTHMQNLIESYRQQKLALDEFMTALCKKRDELNKNQTYSECYYVINQIIQKIEKMYGDYTPTLDGISELVHNIKKKMPKWKAEFNETMKYYDDLENQFGYYKQFVTSVDSFSYLATQPKLAALDADMKQIRESRIISEIPDKIKNLKSGMNGVPYHLMMLYGDVNKAYEDFSATDELTILKRAIVESMAVYIHAAATPSSFWTGSHKGHRASSERRIKDMQDILRIVNTINGTPDSLRVAVRNRLYHVKTGFFGNSALRESVAEALRVTTVVPRVGTGSKSPPSSRA